MQTASSILKAMLFACAGANLLVLGILGMALAGMARRRRLARCLEGKALPSELSRNASLFHPWREQLFGALITLAVPIFAHFALMGSARDLVAMLLGYLAAGFCAMGCFCRQRQELAILEPSAEEFRAICRILAYFAISLALALWGLFSLGVGAMLFFVSNQA